MCMSVSTKTSVPMKALLFKERTVAIIETKVEYNLHGCLAILGKHSELVRIASRVPRKGESHPNHDRYLKIT